MTVLDWVILAVLGYFLIRGLSRGFLVELFDFVALIAGYLAARFLGPTLGYILADSTPMNRWFAGVAAAVALFIVAAVATRLLARLLRRVLRSAALGGIDRGLGALFGGLKALVLVLAVLFLLSLTPWASSIGRYALGGAVSSYMWVGSQMVRERVKLEPITQSQVMAKVLRALGLNDEAVHIITDRPDLMGEMLEYARRNNLDVPVEQIRSGEPAVKLPEGLELSTAAQESLVTLLEDTSLTAAAKAERFWRLLRPAVAPEEVEPQ